MIIHGVKEGQLKEELDLIKRIEFILKLEDKDKKYLELLPFITEDYKGWNYLKQKNILNLQITELALENNPKSYQAWYHRLYVYKSNPKLLLNQIEREIKLISLLLKFDNRNFHCWNYKEGIRRLLELGMIESRDGGDDKGRVGDGGSGNEDGREGDGGSGNEDGREGDGGSGNEDGSEGDEDGSEGDEDGSEVSEGLKDDKVKESKDSKESKDRDSHTSPTTSPTLTPTTLTHTHLNSLNSIQYSISNYSFLHSFGNFNPCSAIFTDPYEDCVWFYFILKREEYLLRKGVYIRKYKNRLEIHFKKNYSGDLIFNLDKKEIKINIKYPTKIYKIGNNDNVNISMNNNNVVLNNIPLSLLKLFPSSPLKFNLLPDTLYFSNSLFLELKDLEPNCNLNYIFNLNQNEEFRELLKEKDFIRKKYYEEEDKYEIYC